MYRMTRSRLVANLLAFSTEDADNAKYRTELKNELRLFKEEYRTLLYGGPMRLMVRSRVLVHGCQGRVDKQTLLH